MLAGLIAGCGGAGSKKLNERVTLWRHDKIPYGTWYAYENLQHIFPASTEVVINKRSPDRYKGLKLGETKVSDEPLDLDKRHAYIIISGQVRPDRNELNALLSLVEEGNQVFISSFWIGQNLLDTLKLSTEQNFSYFNIDDSLTVTVNNPVTKMPASFTYPGKRMDNFFNAMDSSTTTILGYDKEGKANFVRIGYTSGGAFYLHLAPTALTNFFLLHKNNKAYYDNVLSHLPSNVEVVHWDDYFRYHANGEGGEEQSGFSALSWLKKQPGLNTAWWLGLLLLLLVFLFESKRKQRIIPAIASLRNASLDFVKTIGRLYFQRKDNKNLAQKMGAHFLDHVRNRYNIRTAVMDEDFEKRLAYKSGYSLEAVHNLVYQLKLAQDDMMVSDHSLLDLHHQLDNFYKHA